MLVRRDTLQQALADIESGTLTGADSVVVSRSWWDRLSSHEQDGYRHRAAGARVRLSADDGLGAHFVEVRGGGTERRISTEREI